MKKLFLLLFLATVCCSQTVWKGLGWDHSYKDTHGHLMDTTDIYFKFFHSTDLIFTEFGQAIGGDSTFIFINSNPEFYDNKVHSFYMRAYSTILDTFSLSSDTVSVKLIVPTPNSVEQFIFLKQ